MIRSIYLLSILYAFSGFYHCKLLENKHARFHIKCLFREYIIFAYLLVSTLRTKSHLPSIIEKWFRAG